MLQKRAHRQRAREAGVFSVVLILVAGFAVAVQAADPDEVWGGIQGMIEGSKGLGALEIAANRLGSIDRSDFLTDPVEFLVSEGLSLPEGMGIGWLDVAEAQNIGAMSEVVMFGAGEESVLGEEQVWNAAFLIVDPTRTTGVVIARIVNDVATATGIDSLLENQANAMLLGISKGEMAFIANLVLTVASRDREDRLVADFIDDVLSYAISDAVTQGILGEGVRFEFFENYYLLSFDRRVESEHEPIVFIPEEGVDIEAGLIFGVGALASVPDPDNPQITTDFAVMITTQ